MMIPFLPMAKTVSPLPTLDVAVVIAAPPARILKAFFEPDALNAWLQVSHAVTTPRLLGPYAMAWPATEFRDETLGRLGGVFRGTVMQYQAGHGFFVADVYFLPPDGDPIGPMAFEVTCTPEASSTRVHVTQRGFEEGARWRRYYEVIAPGWERALLALKALLER
jgi:uncharacterized protein YndB with AHSA1/START domain